jgi:hypothetical protein
MDGCLYYMIEDIEEGNHKIQTGLEETANEGWTSFILFMIVSSRGHLLSWW